MFNAIHNLQAGTPVENIVAMVDAVHQFNAEFTHADESHRPFRPLPAR